MTEMLTRDRCGQTQRKLRVKAKRAEMDALHTWIRLDASYKQYAYSQPMDIKSAVSFDSQAFMDQIRSTATINETEGYVTNLNSLFIQQTMDDYRTRVDTY
ncbi:MAG TPA: hypothetical protein VN260_09690, partial [Dissulfurispiraceae bacterium]|nr:hypothetical protein [Dissulfurispiraceae bacterium]